MIGLFFEVMPRPGHEQAYFDIAAGLRPELDKNPGLLFIDRFRSLVRQNLVLSHSHWRDEASLAKWRSHAKHHAAQLAGRRQHFEDYRLRIGELVCEWLPALGELRRSEGGGSYNVNADTFAGAIAGALKAKRFLLLTDVPGVLDKSKHLIKELSVNDARRLIADGTISGGMIPKVETCIYALERGVEGVVILDGKVEHAVLLELLTDLGAGTLIHR